MTHQHLKKVREFCLCAAKVLGATHVSVGDSEPWELTKDCKEISDLVRDVDRPLMVHFHGGGAKVGSLLFYLDRKSAPSEVLVDYWPANIQLHIS